MICGTRSDDLVHSDSKHKNKSVSPTYSFLSTLVTHSPLIFIKEIIISSSLSLVSTSTAMDYISESTDVYNNSDRDVSRFDSIHNKSKQSELETDSIIDDCNIYVMIFVQYLISFFS